MRKHKSESEERCRTCRYAESIGQLAVYVSPNCPHGHLIRDRLVTPRRICEICKADVEVCPTDS